MFEVIERLKSEWTDRYVVINSRAPELARFANATGTVKTVNMNGRCLVEFDQFNNIGWYDIHPSALKIVPQPLPKPVEKEAAKPTAVKPAAAAKPAATIPAAKPTASIPAAKPGVARPSTAAILAAARAKAGGAAPQPAAAQPVAPAKKKPAASETGPLEVAVDEVAIEEVAVKSAATKKPAGGSGGAAPTTTAEKIAWCQKHDAKG